MSVAFAVNGATAQHTITITNSDQVGTHTYDAYQVFAGDYESSSGKLSNITWGAGVDGTAILNAVKEDTTTFGTEAASAASAEDVAALLGTGNDTDKAMKFAAIVGAHLKTPATKAGISTYADDKYTITVTGDGYYFIQDQAGTLPTDTNNDGTQKADAATRFMLQVVGTVTVAAKSNTVESSKKIGDTNDSTGTKEPSRDSADYDIGDKIPYTLTAKLPANYDKFDKYYLQFVDDMSAGLTYNNDAKIYYGASDTTGETIELTEDATVNSSYTGGKVYKATINDLKTTKSSLAAGAVIRIEYTATLNANAKVGEEGNPNKSHIVFSNNPNSQGDGDKGTTPDDTVIAFTYDVEVDKVTGTEDNLTALAGAKFSLYKLFKDDATLTAVNADRAENKKYTKVTEIKYDNGTKDYTIGSGEVWALVEAKTTGSGTGANVFNFSGVDDGTYLLVETETPAGYNSIKPAKFTITANHTDGVTPSYGTPSAESVNDTNHTQISLGAMTRKNDDNQDKNVGLKTNVINNGGSTLPSTGGIGTTIFYVAGSILVLAAAILLITKRRMGADD